MKKGDVKRIVLTRPAVEAGENLGFLPGDLKEKVDPYLTPLYDALRVCLGNEKTEVLIEKGTIEIAPLAYMRGRTLDDCYVILDEAQNTTTSQMTFAQIGMANAIDQEDVKKEVQHMVDTFASRRTFIMEQLDQCKNLFYIKPHGAFYIMVDVSKTGLNGQEFADKLLEYGVAVVPANGFGKDFSDFIRISFASSKESDNPV